MKQQSETAAWKLYEAGKDYKRRIGLYETVRRNERFYRGEQWSLSDDGLPRPVFNLCRGTEGTVGPLHRRAPAVS